MNKKNDDIREQARAAIDRMEAYLNEGWSLQYSKAKAGINYDTLIWKEAMKDERFLKLNSEKRTIHYTPYGTFFRSGYRHVKNTENK